MSLDWFFEKFELIADLPNAVAKMRELVIDLSVQGKLLQEQPDDDPAEKIVTMVEALRREMKCRIYAAVNPTQAPFPLPSSWTWVRLGNIALASDSGWSPQCLPVARSGTNWGVLKVSAVSWGVFNPDENKALAPEMQPREECEVKAGDFLLSRANTAELVARSVIVGAAPPKLMMSDKIVRFRFFNCIEPAYVNLANRASHSRAYYSRNASGTSNSMKNVTRDTMCNLPIPLPPLAEQKRIVAKVDELMALCDELEAQQQEREARKSVLARAALSRFAAAPTPANLNLLFHPSYTIPPSELRKTILTLAVRGKLVPQDPNDEPAEAILARVASTKLRLQKTGEIGTEKPLEPLQSDSLPFEAPDSWRWARLAEITELITKGSSPKWQGVTYVTEPEGILFITSENVGNYALRKLEDLKYVSKEFNEIEPRSILKRGDILMNLVGASIGRTAAYNLPDGANINQAVALIRLVRETDGVCPRFLLHYLNSPSAIDYMLSSRVVNAQPNISLSDARRFAIPLPPLAEQRRIVAKVEDMLALVDALEQQLESSRVAATKLLTALVAELTDAQTR